ncbi:hypothetical protein H4219_001604 [Mycoemilia scoparia]|uniref:COPI associated protein n=1 Tax=Mycoemilia scoparia TaxID=417184 RepID=A0A9W8A035_9FUNG|nr:hypothetical protein H4219_001604 [Mycoemilia scoparia]
MAAFFGSYLLQLAVNVLNIIACCLLVGVSVINIVKHESPTNVIIYNVYTACLFLALVVAEFKPPVFVAEQMRFLLTYRGRGLLYTFFGCLVYTSVTFNIVACIFISTLGVALFVLSWVSLASPRHDIRYNWNQFVQHRTPGVPESYSSSSYGLGFDGIVATKNVPVDEYHKTRRQMGYLYDQGSPSVNDIERGSDPTSNTNHQKAHIHDSNGPHFHQQAPMQPYSQDANALDRHDPDSRIKASAVYPADIRNRTSDLPKQGAQHELHDHKAKDHYPRPGPIWETPNLPGEKRNCYMSPQPADGLMQDGKFTPSSLAQSSPTPLPIPTTMAASPASLSENLSSISKALDSDYFKPSEEASPHSSQPANAEYRNEPGGAYSSRLKPTVHFK